MKFQFYRNDKNLAKPVKEDGCGLSAAELLQITEQGNAEYEFCYHTGYHGKGDGHYVYIREAGSVQKTGCSRVFINGDKAGQCENTAELKKKLVTDACATVSAAANNALFLRIAKNQT